VIVAVGVAIGRSTNGRSSTRATNDVNVMTVRVRRMDLVATEQVTGALGYGSAPILVNHLAGTYTAIPEEGAIVRPGQSLFAVDGQPVTLLHGATPAWRAFTPGMSNGPDIAQLQAALASQVAPTLRVDGHYGRATVAAVRVWRAGRALPPDDGIPFGLVAFFPDAVRVGAHDIQVGDAAQAGQSPYATTATARVVMIQLDVGRRGDVNAGQPATINLPGGTSVPGRVSSVGRVARAPTSQTGTTQPAVTVIVTPAGPGVDNEFDEEPVAVELITARRAHVLAVPVTALLALAEGGYGVEAVQPNGTRHIVAVQPGLFSDTMVEVRGGIDTTTTVVTAR
jgi:peptidoglycan hydrolase-like protein with peptidoglycan-binding domain